MLAAASRRSSNFVPQIVTFLIIPSFLAFNHSLDLSEAELGRSGSSEVIPTRQRPQPVSFSSGSANCREHRSRRWKTENKQQYFYSLNLRKPLSGPRAEGRWTDSDLYAGPCSPRRWWPVCVYDEHLHVFLLPHASSITPSGCRTHSHCVVILYFVHIFLVSHVDDDLNDGCNSLRFDALLYPVFLINMICFFWYIRLFFIGKNTLAAHYFPIISTFVLAVGVCVVSVLQRRSTSRWRQQPDRRLQTDEAWSCWLVFTSLISTVSD